MEDILRAVALGVIQGLTEFLPVSSSGHLIVTRELFGWEFADDLTFDVALHLGTTVAVIAFFWSEWLAMLRSGWEWLCNRDRQACVHLWPKCYPPNMRAELISTSSCHSERRPRSRAEGCIFAKESGGVGPRRQASAEKGPP